MPLFAKNLRLLLNTINQQQLLKLNMDQSLKALLTKRVDGSALSYKQISVTEGGGDLLTISLQRTIRVPDNEKSFELPHDLGPFPIYSIFDHKDVLQSVLVKKRGAFIPIYRRTYDQRRFEGWQANLCD